jgi:hypothetical protein
VVQSLIIAGVLLIFAGVAKAIQDKTSFHWHKSIFSKIKNKKIVQWLNPELSWKNKHEWFKNNKFLTWVISNPLVLFSDAWHLFGFLKNFLLLLSGILLPLHLLSLLFYFVFTLTFHLFFTYIFSIRTNK